MSTLAIVLGIISFFVLLFIVCIGICKGSESPHKNDPDYYENEEGEMIRYK